MRTYVTSTAAGSRLAHIGNLVWIACGAPLRRDILVVSEEPPENRPVCNRCLKHYEPIPPTARQHAQASRRAARAARLEAKEQRILNGLKQGKSFKNLCREQAMGQRSLVRHVSRMRRRVGARTLFQFGYLVGLAERPDR